MIEFEGCEYTEDEAKALAGWLTLPEAALLDRYFEMIRAQSVEVMDSGNASMDMVEFFVQNSAIRRIIADVRRMSDDLYASVSEQEPKSLDK